LEALRRERLIDATDAPDLETLVRTAHAYLARAKSILAITQLDDLTDESEPVNVPATGNEYPNWRRRLCVNLEELASLSRFSDIMAIFARERGRGGYRAGSGQRSAATSEQRPGVSGP
jgi:4-alpha-glucanotransferase